MHRTRSVVPSRIIGRQAHLLSGTGELLGVGWAVSGV